MLGAAPLLRLVLIRGLAPRTLFQRVLKRMRPMVLNQQVGECLVGKLLEALSAGARKQIDCLPGLGVEADQFALGRHSTVH